MPLLGTELNTYQLQVHCLIRCATKPSSEVVYYYKIQTLFLHEVFLPFICKSAYSAGQCWVGSSFLAKPWLGRFLQRNRGQPTSILPPIFTFMNIFLT